MGVKSKTIHSLSQALGTGVVFLELQLKEYTAAFLTFRDSIFGSDFYGTTCLHGLHVTTGSTSFGILWCSLNNNEGYKEVHQYQKFWGYYWHLVDSIWISLFMLFYLRIIFKAIDLHSYSCSRWIWHWIFHFHSMGLFLYREILCYPTPINFNYWYGIGLLLVFLLVNQVLTVVVLGLDLDSTEYTDEYTITFIG